MSTQANLPHVAAGSASGTTDGTVAFTVDPLTTTGTRTGTLTIGSQTYTVTQYGIDYLASGPSFTQGGVVPNVVGQTQSAATAAIGGLGLIVATTTQTLNSTVPVGSVISSNPAAGTLIALGSPVSLVISGQPTIVPNVVFVPASTSSITRLCEVILPAAGRSLIGRVDGSSSYQVRVVKTS